MTPSSNLRQSPFLGRYNAWFPKSDDELNEALRTGIVTLDTNVLLDLYKFEESATDEWIRALAMLENRLFISAQVADEFWNNREAMVASPQDVLATEAKIIKSRDGIEDAFNAWLDKRNVVITEDQEIELNKIKASVDALLRDLDAAKTSHQRRFSVNPERDQVACGIARLFQGPTPASLGKPYSETESRLKEKEGAERFSKKIAPGFMDDGDNPNAKNKKTGVSKYGDWFVWDQFLTAAREFIPKPQESCKYAVLVTGDMKKDWWHRSPDEGEATQTRIALPELTNEMRKRASSKYIQLTPQNFLTALRSALGASISDATVAAATQQYWYEEDFFLSSSKNKFAARARMSPDGECRVLRGSSARLHEVASLSNSYVKLRKQLVDKNILHPSEDVSRFLFTCDYTFTSPSAAACVISASSMNGKSSWKTESGEPLSEIEKIDANAHTS